MQQKSTLIWCKQHFHPPPLSLLPPLIYVINIVSKFCLFEKMKKLFYLLTPSILRCVARLRRSKNGFKEKGSYSLCLDPYF